MFEHLVDLPDVAPDEYESERPTRPAVPRRQAPTSPSTRARGRLGEAVRLALHEGMAEIPGTRLR